MAHRVKEICSAVAVLANSGHQEPIGERDQRYSRSGTVRDLLGHPQIELARAGAISRLVRCGGDR